MKTYFYYLVEPETQEIRYIGQSKNPRQRLAQHVSAVKNGRDKNTRKANWIKHLLNQGLLPDLIIFETYLGSADGAHKREWQLINEALERGVRLVNGNDGGMPYLLPDDRVKPVYKYDKNTLMFIKKYRTAFDASIETGIKDANISKSAKSIDKHRVQFAGGFLWSYEYFTVFPKDRLLFSIRHNKKAVRATNLATNEVTEHESARHAAECLKLSYRNISQVCKGEKKSHKGYTFSFI